MSTRIRVGFTAGVCALTVAVVAGSALAGGWVEYENQSSTRLNVAASLGINDPDEKDYAWGDIDQDGDIDLVSVRKQPYTSAGKRPNVLLMNENGVLVDRSAQYASAADVPGDQGFLTPTNDRDVQLVDVDLDGWLDMVTAVTVSDNDPKHIGHPRIYMNLGEVDGEWQGFEYQEARIPFLFSYSGSDQFNPRFCSVSVGDVTGDGYPELWFGDYDSSGAGGVNQPAGADYNDRLLINLGDSQGPEMRGFYVDSTQTRVLGQIQVSGFGNLDFDVSAFGAANAIRDMNGDGYNDIVKQTSLNNPFYVGVGYNALDSSGNSNPGDEGFFDQYEHLTGAASDPYFITVGDLNNDERLDIVVVNDAVDRYLLNTGNGSDGKANWNAITFNANTNGFGGNAVIADLDNDGWQDVIIADVDVDIAGCTRDSDFLQNNGNSPSVTFTHHTPQSLGIPDPDGYHDVAPFDLNGDGWLDLVIGYCLTDTPDTGGTYVFINQPPIGLNFSYPGGLPETVTPNAEATFQVQLSPFGGEVAAGSAALHYSVDGAAYVEAALNDQGAGLYEATLPAVECTSQIEYYVSAELEGGASFTDPPTAPGSTFDVLAIVGTGVAFDDNIEGDVSGWTVTNDPSLTAGAWEAADPNGTVQVSVLAAPEDDATPNPFGTRAFVTGNGLPGGSSSVSDVDGGPTVLTTPVLDLAGTDPTVSYQRWFFSSVGTIDSMTVQITNNGVDWVLLETVTNTGSSWQPASFIVSNYVEPTATVQVRFSVCDCPNDSITEAGVDDFQVVSLECGECSSDLNGDETVDAADLALLLGAWGPNPGNIADLNQDGTVNAADLALLLGAWGPCL